MNYAICYLAVHDDRALRLCEMSYRTLRTAGFIGDVHIITDKPEALRIYDHAAHIHVVSEKEMNVDRKSTAPLALCDARRLDMRNPRNKKMAEKFAICHAKTLLGTYIDIEDYDYVVYLDADILVQGSLSAFEELLKKHNRSIIVSQSRMCCLGGKPFFLSGTWFKKTTVAANLSKWELLKFWHIKPLCADIVCIPGTPLGKRMVSRWLSICQEGVDSDQAALQALLLREFRNEYILASYSIFGYGLDKHQFVRGEETKKVESVFVHFNGAMVNPGAFEEYERRFLS
jgi:hypothetical protein